MQIQTSLDWDVVRTELADPLLSMTYSNAKQLRIILRNIETLIAELGNEEITCRRMRRQTSKHKELIIKINEYIAHFESLRTFAALLT
jgi:hypothetical protein